MRCRSCAGRLLLYVICSPLVEVSIYFEGVIMKRILGKVTRKIAKENNIEEQANKKIVLYDNDRKHCQNKHAKEFGDMKTFHYVMDNLEYIIENPDHVFYVKNNSTLEYYKTFDFGITVRVKVEEGPELRVKTVFTVKNTKIENRLKDKEYNKYVISEETMNARNS